MKVVGLVSGGKDSCYNMVQCVAAGHEIVALANLRPQPGLDELDSYMFQTVGHDCIELVAEAMDLPLYRADIAGSSVNTGRDYTETRLDEVEDLFSLLKRVRDETGVGGVSVGAILSDYQRVRVEDVCRRLGLTSLAYLWRRDQAELLSEMVNNGMECVLVKVACLGLHQEHLGKTLLEMEPTLTKLNKQFGVNVCGEGGEYETITLDCPLFKKRLLVLSKKVINHSDDAFAPVSYLQMELSVTDKPVPTGATQLELLQKAGISIRTPDSFVEDFLTIRSVALDKIPATAFLEVSTEDISYQENNSGWFELSNISGRGTSPTEAVENAFSILKDKLKENEKSLSDIVRVSMLIARMEDYPEMNSAYVKNFGLNPPVRVCVALGEDRLPVGAQLVLTVRGVAGDRACLHVQGVSHWAPANIGPYSQGVSVGGVVHVSGQIGLVPGSMKMIPGALSQAALALRHTDRVIKAMDPCSGLHNATQAVCYVVDDEGAEAAKAMWAESSAKETSLQVWKVFQLPRNAAVEWEVVAQNTATSVTDSLNGL